MDINMDKGKYYRGISWQYVPSKLELLWDGAVAISSEVYKSLL
jgi:hypothetical protein